MLAKTEARRPCRGTRGWPPESRHTLRRRSLAHRCKAYVTTHQRSAATSSARRAACSKRPQALSHRTRWLRRPTHPIDGLEAQEKVGCYEVSNMIHSLPYCLRCNVQRSCCGSKDADVDARQSISHRHPKSPRCRASGLSYRFRPPPPGPLLFRLGQPPAKQRENKRGKSTVYLAK